MKGILVYLDDEQKKLVAQVTRAAKEANHRGKPGMVLAQVYEDHMVVGFITNEKAMEILQAMNSEPKITKSALDRR